MNNTYLDVDTLKKLDMFFRVRIVLFIIFEVF